ncbi:unnamed protein product [Microthlaspi erraticum]|uniref:Uncharacterized protein n=1 Tax=Microthlaspi erraticum TaxID=1685480 RepID=A0A6D2K8I0_9BRAS|nr:unnamed protein product [Microthlaspi erraticum]
MLDTASNGNFLNQDVDDGWQLVENIANSNGSYGEEYDRTNGARPTTRSTQSTMKKVNFVSAEEMEPVQEGEDTQFAEVCYMSNGQGGYNKGYYNYKSNPAMSYRNTDVANPQDQVYPQQQAARSSQATTWKLAEINSKIENLNTRVYSLENHASSVAAATKQGQLPGKAIQNPKEQCKVIFTQEGLVEEEDQERVIEDFCLLLNDEEIVAAEAPGVQIDQPEVHAPTVAIHTSPVELAQQARSAARSSRSIESDLFCPTLFCLILTNRLPLPRLAYLVKPRGSDFCATIDSTTLSSKSHGATKVVKERVDKEPRVGKDKDERGPRIEKPRLERARVEKPRLIDHELIDLFKPLVCLMKRAFKLCLMSH